MNPQQFPLEKKMPSDTNQECKKRRDGETLETQRFHIIMNLMIKTYSRAPGPTRGACNVLEWNPRTSQTRWWYGCHDHLGNINRVHPKNINGQTVLSPHYPPTAADLIK